MTKESNNNAYKEINLNLVMNFRDNFISHKDILELSGTELFNRNNKNYILSQPVINLDEALSVLLDLPFQTWEKVKKYQKYFKFYTTKIDELDKIYSFSVKNVRIESIQEIKKIAPHITDEAAINLAQILEKMFMPYRIKQEQELIEELFPSKEREKSGICAFFYICVTVVLKELERYSYLDKDFILGEWKGLDTLISSQKLLEWINISHFTTEGVLEYISAERQATKNTNRSGSKKNTEKHNLTREACQKAVDKIQNEKILDLNRDKFLDIARVFMDNAGNFLVGEAKIFYKNALDKTYKVGVGRKSK